MQIQISAWVNQDIGYANGEYDEQVWRHLGSIVCNTNSDSQVPDLEVLLKAQFLIDQIVLNKKALKNSSHVSLPGTIHVTPIDTQEALKLRYEVASGERSSIISSVTIENGEIPGVVTFRLAEGNGWPYTTIYRGVTGNDQLVTVAEEHVKITNSKIRKLIINGHGYGGESSIHQAHRIKASIR